MQRAVSFTHLTFLALAASFAVGCPTNESANHTGAAMTDDTDGPISSASSQPGSSSTASGASGSTTTDGGTSSDEPPAPPPTASCDDTPTFTSEAAPAIEALAQAIAYFREEVATHDGYVWRYTEDLSRRWGEGEATADQIWVQPPGTPAVGMAFLHAYEATCDATYLDAAHDTATTLLYGQLVSGGWAKAVDFDPDGSQSAAYRNGLGSGKNNSQLDDDTSQSVIRLLSRVDAAQNHKDPALEEAVTYALERLLANGQYANGGFGQIWTDDPVEVRSVLAASYYPGAWPDTYPGGDYWWHYTTNDEIPGTVAGALIAAYEAYGHEAYRDALVLLGDFLLLAQMPEPQPGWAQQYDADMHPAWARRFEPPAVTGWESQDAMEALIEIAEFVDDPIYLEPLPRALDYYDASVLSDGQLARFYELETNTPLYMTSDYALTYDDADLPTHYGFKMPSRLGEIRAEYERVAAGDPPPTGDYNGLRDAATAVIDAMDDRGRWVDDGEILSATFIENVETLAAFIAAARESGMTGANSRRACALVLVVGFGCTIEAPPMPDEADTESGIAFDSDASSGEDDDAPSGSSRLDIPDDPDGAPLPNGGACEEGSPGHGTGDFGFIWIANSPEGTVSKIDTRTGVEVGRYATGPDRDADDPSRTSVNLEGDVAVTNRGGRGVAPGSVTKIGAIDDHCVDANGDGVITTSTGPSDILPWGEDECVLWRHEVPSRPAYSVGPRPTAWDAGENPCSRADDRVWVGWHDPDTQAGVFRRLAGLDGTLLDEVDVPQWVPTRNDHGPYGGAVDGSNNFWVMGLAGPLVRIDGATLKADRWEVPADTSPYGIAVDGDGTPWLAGQLGDLSRFDPATETWELYVVDPDVPTRLRGLQVGADGQLWAARNNPCGLVQFDTHSRTFVDSLIPLPGCGQPVGVSVDADGYIWLPDRDTDRAYRVDPLTHDILEVAGLVSPYTYSDMTGAGLELVWSPPEG